MSAFASSCWRSSTTPVGLEPFWEWYEQLSKPMRAQATGPVLNKLRAFLLRRNVRAIVGQQRSSIDVTRLLGSFVVARVWQAALARAGRAVGRWSALT